MKKIGQVVKDIFFPPVTELEIITFFFLLLLTLITSKNALVELFQVSFSSASNIVSMALFIIVFTGFVYNLYRKLFIHALKKQKMSQSDKRFLAFWFYFILSYLSFDSLVGTHSNDGISLIDKINDLSLNFMFIRSAASFFITGIIGRLGLEEVLVTQIGDEQVDKKELILMTISAILIYFSLHQTNDLPSTIVLGYFYTTSLVLAFRKVVGK